MYKIGRFELENFKSISKKFFLDFSNVDTVILDGPNGFGKTTLFDALELCFTGKISRFESSTGSNDPKAKNSHILKFDNATKTTILLELINTKTESTIVIQACIPAGIKGVKASIRDYKLSISREYKSDWESQEPWLPLTSEILGDIINLKSIDSLFHIQHYIQQEETAGFLKNNNEGNRHKQLSQLFGTATQNQDAEKLEALKKSLDVLYKKSKSDLEELEKQALSLSAISEPEEKKTFPSGLCELILQPSILSLSTDQIKSLKAELDVLRPIADAPDKYFSLLSNNTVDILLLEREQQLNDLIRLGAAKSYSDLDKVYKSHSKWLTLLKKLETAKKIIASYHEDQNTVSEKLITIITSNFPPDQSTLQLLSELENQRLKGGGLSIALDRLNSSRNSLIEAYKAILPSTADHQILCPLCGDLKEEGLPQLISEIDKHYLTLMESASESTLRTNEIIEKLLPSFILKIIKKCQHLVSKYSKYCTVRQKNFFDQKLINKERFEQFKKVQYWLTENGVDLSSIIDQDIMLFSENYETQLIAIKTKINKLKIYIDYDFPTYKNIISAAKNLQLSKANLEKLTENDIKSDYNYLSFIDFTNTSTKISNNSSQQIKIRNRLSKISRRRESVFEIFNIYKKEIQNYESNVAAKIAIPFYVYSSKVLQTRPEGTGIFLKTLDSDTKGSIPYIRFCSERDDDHDAWYTMSSGQLSGLIISFALAMNKLYPSNFYCVLIDDPMQSMDEINMASLTQLLRYEFHNHQFILSTHDANTSSYINYKFIRSGNRVERVNLKSKSATFN